MESLQSFQPDPQPGAMPGTAGLWIDRRAEAERIVQFILASRCRLVLLYGQRGIGKTSLIKTLVMRLVPADREAFYGRCEGMLPTLVGSLSGSTEELWSAAGRANVIFLDGFESVLDLPDAEREPLLRELCKRATAGAGVLALVLQEDRLGRAFALRAYLPAILESALEIQGIGARSGLDELRLGMAGSSLRYEDEALEALAADAAALDARSACVAPDLLRVVDAQFQRFQAESGKTTVGLADYRARGGLREILRDYLAVRLGGLESGRELALVLLDELARGPRPASALDDEELCERTDSSGDLFEQVLAWLRGPGGLLQERDGGRLEVVPAALAIVIEQDAARATSEVRQLLRQGLESWREVSALLSPASFEAVHRERHRLGLTREEIELMLLCAVHHGAPNQPGRALYWLRRLRPRQAAVGRLILLLSDPSPQVRSKAAVLLAFFDEPEVRHELHMLALRDPVPEVRTRAISSLQGMASEDLREFLLQEISDARSRYREAAVDTLRIFPCERTAKALQGLVGDPASPGGLRARAIAVLADLEVAEAADALVEIALLDGDPENRDEAGGCLAAAASEPLLRRALQRLRGVYIAPDAAPPGWRTGIWNLARLAASVGLVVANLYVHGLILLFIGRYRLGVTLLVLEGVGLLIFKGVGPPWFLTLLLGQLVPMSILLLARRERRLKLGSLRGTLAITLFIANALSSLLLFHGLAHAAIRRSRRALVLLALELTALFLGYFIYHLPLVFSAGVGGAPRQDLSAALLIAYWVLAAALFVGTYLFDVLVVAYDTIFFTRRHEHEVRRQGLYDRLVANPIAATVVLDQLTGTVPGDIAWARTILRRSGGFMPPELLLDRLGDGPARRLVYSTLVRKEGSVVPLLRALWQTADGEKRQRIVRLLSRRPTEGSLAALEELWPQLSRRERARAFLSFWHFRFRVWPKAFILAMLFAFPLLVLFCYQGFRALANPAELQMKMLSDEQEESPKRIVSAKFLAEVFPSRELVDQLETVLATTKKEEVKIGVVQSLTAMAAAGHDPFQQDKALRALAMHLGRQESPQVRSGILEGLETVAQTAPYPVASGAPGLALSRMLRDPQENSTFRHRALDVLEASGAVNLIAGLAAAGPAPVSSPQDGDAQQLDAISALGRIATLEAHQALLRLQEDPRLAKELRASARSEAAGMRQRLREELADERYEAVLSKASSFEGVTPEVIPRRELLLLLGAASAGLATHVADVDPGRAHAMREAAIAHLEEAGRLPPEEARLLAEAYIARGSELHREHHPGAAEEAREQWKKALAADPTLPQAQKDWLHAQSVTAPTASSHR